MIRAVLFDLDGVIRHFDVEPLAVIERRHGLAPKTILSALLGPSRLRATTGLISDETWRRSAADQLGGQVGIDFLAWDGLIGFVDPQMVELVARVRSRVAVGLLTNATSRLASDLRQLGLAEAFDVVVNTSDIGFAKPDPKAFDHAATELGVPPEETLFIDDTLRNVEAAASLGFSTHRFESVDALTDVLKAKRLI